MSGDARAKPHLLYVAFAYPPSTASSVYRCLAVPNAFAEAGWDVTVLTIDGEAWSEISGLDVELLNSVNPSVRVIRISDGGSEERARGNLRAFPRLRVEAPYVWERLLSLRSTRSFPEAFHGLWLKPASAAALDIHREHSVDLVLGSASPYVTFAVASSLPGVPYVMDYRDAWAFNTISGDENFAVDSHTGRRESALLREAMQAWFVNDQIRDEYARRYPDTAAKMRVVPNGFDPQPGHGRPDVRPATKPSFGYLGTLQHENYPLDEFFDGWVDAFGATGESDTPAATAHIRGKLSSSGGASPELLRKFDSVRRHGLEYGGPVPKRQVAQFYESMDALILLLASGRYVTGGKTAEYLATGLPIVSVHELSNATTDMLRDYPLWFPAREMTAPAISAALRACAQELRTPDEARWAAAWDYGQSFLRSTMMAPVIDELTRSVSRPLHDALRGGAADQKSPDPLAAPVPARSMIRATDQASVSAGDMTGAKQVKVLVVMQEGGAEVLKDLRSRVGSIDGIAVSLVPFVANEAMADDEVRTIPVAQPGFIEGLSQRLSAAPNIPGAMGRLLHDNLRSRRFARSVLMDDQFMSEALAADVVMAGDSGATRAVWQLKSRTRAGLVRGAVALVHVLRTR